jgi:hypothetical protein
MTIVYFSAESMSAELEEKLVRFKENSKKKSDKKKSLLGKFNESSRNLIVVTEEKRRLVEELDEKRQQFAELTERKDQLFEQLKKTLVDAAEEKNRFVEKLSKKRQKLSEANDEIKALKKNKSRIQLTPGCLSRFQLKMIVIVIIKYFRNTTIMKNKSRIQLTPDYL